MRTDELIAVLAADDSRPGWVGGRFGAVLAVGVLAALIGLWITLGPPLAARAERWEAASLAKLLYPLSIALIAAAAAVQAGRPGADAGGRVRLLAIPLLLVAAGAIVDMAAEPPSGWAGLLFGSTFWTCLAAVTVASVPLFAGLTWAFSLLAPTRPRLAGFLVGLASGAAGAVAYAFYCPELSPAFLLATYTLAMLIPALAGAMAGPRLFRW